MHRQWRIVLEAGERRGCLATDLRGSQLRNTCTFDCELDAVVYELCKEPPSTFVLWLKYKHAAQSLCICGRERLLHPTYRER